MRGGYGGQVGIVLGFLQLLPGLLTRGLYPARGREREPLEKRLLRFGLHGDTLSERAGCRFAASGHLIVPMIVEICR